MVSNITKTETCSKRLCLAMTPTEFEMFEKARQCISEQRGRDVSQREFLVSMCQTICYTISKDEKEIDVELDRALNEIKELRARINNLIFDLQSLKDGLYGPCEDTEAEE